MTLSGPERLYDLMDDLRDADCVVHCGRWVPMSTETATCSPTGNTGGFGTLLWALAKKRTLSSRALTDSLAGIVAGYWLFRWLGVRARRKGKMGQY